MQTLHSLYTAQVATIVWTAESNGPLEVDRRNVVVGIALRKSDCMDGGGLSQQERDVFVGVMDMLRDSLAGN
jgi:proteasome assembly chaperone 3